MAPLFFASYALGVRGAAQRFLSASALALASTAGLPSAFAAVPPKRPVPAYDGRAPEPKSTGERLLIVPRAVLFPLHAVFEYGVRRPAGAVATYVERKQLLAFVADKLENDALKLGVWPIFFVDYGARPSVGLRVWKRAFLSPNNDLEGHVSTWGPTWMTVGLLDRWVLGGGTQLDTRASWTHRPDSVFHGVGPRSLQANGARYGIDRLEASPKIVVSFGRSSSFGFKGGLRAVWFGDRTCCDYPTLRERVNLGTYAAPPGFDRGGYTAAYQQIELTLDSRRPRPASQSGVRLDVFAEEGADVRATRPAHWLKYGGVVGAFYDLDGKARVLGLTLTTLFADPLRGEIPFTEQVSLGGNIAMQGYLPGRLIDRSALVLTTQYHWPVWAWADGVVQVAAGNVFGAHLAELSSSLFRLSFGTGLRTTRSPAAFSELLVGGGTETLADGLRVTSFRFFLGNTRGF